LTATAKRSYRPFERFNVPTFKAPSSVPPSVTPHHHAACRRHHHPRCPSTIGTFTYEFEVTLPLVARDTFHGGPTAYSWLLGAFGVGAVLGGLRAAKRASTGIRALVAAAAGFGLATLAAALAPAFWIEVVLLTLVGATSVTFLTRGNSTAQLAAAPEFRGRVTALWSTAFVGTTPIGAPIVGALADQAGPRWSLALGAIACLLAVLIGLALLRRHLTAATAHPDHAHARGSTRLTDAAPALGASSTSSALLMSLT
jgi:MFS family permease